MLLIGCSDQPPAVLLASAKTFLAADDPSAAQLQLKRVLQKTPDSVEARLLLGRAFLSTGNAASALVELERAEKLGASPDQVVPDLARALTMNGQRQRVVDEYAKTQLSDKTRASALSEALGVAYLGLGQREQALALADLSLAQDSARVSARLLRARLLLGSDRKQALALVQQVLDGDPKNTAALQLRADIQCLADARAQACLDANRNVLAIQADYLPALAALVEAHLARSNTAAARTALAAMAAVDSQGPQTRFYEARVELAEGHLEKARDLAQALLRSFPEHDRLLEFAATVEMESGSTFQAIAMLKKALLRDPKLLGARRLLALAYLRSGDSQRATETIEPLLKIGDVDAQLLMAQTHMMQGRFDLAEPLFKRALQSRPDDAKARTAFAVAQLVSGSVDPSLTELERIAAVDSGTTADRALVAALMRHGKFDAALSAIDRLQRKDPKNPESFDTRGRVQLMRSDRDGARKSFEEALQTSSRYVPALLTLVGMDLQDKQPDRAQARLAGALKADPRNTPLTLAMADLLINTGAKPEAVTKLLTEAARLNSTDPALRVALIDHLVKHRDRAAASVVAQEALAAFPNDTLLLGAMGRLQFERGEFEQAVATYNTAAATNQQAVEPLLRASEVHVRQRKYAAARDDLLRALERQPASVAAQRGLVALALLENKPTQALRAARELQERVPQGPFGLVLEGDIHVALKNWPAATTAYREALVRGATTEVASKLFVSLLGGGKLPEARVFAGQWLEKHPADIEFMFQAGNITLSNSDNDDARKFFTMVVERQPNNALALNNLAWLRLKAKQPGALPLAERASKSMPNSVEILDTYSSALLADGQAAQALSVQQRAVKLAPDNRQLRLQLARAALAAGDRPLARRELEALAALGSRFSSQAEVSSLLASI